MLRTMTGYEIAVMAVVSMSSRRISDSENPERVMLLLVNGGRTRKFHDATFTGAAVRTLKK